MFKIRKSNISGKGTFATKDIQPNTDLGIAFKIIDTTGDLDKNIQRTKLGIFTNHSSSPNLDIIKSLGVYKFMSNKHIPANTELNIDYQKFDFDGKRDFT